MKRLILVDGNSLMYRAYYGMAATGNIKANSKGMYTNAIFAFARMINNLTNSEYDNMLVAFDKGKHTFRHDIISDYKAGRAKMPDEMRMQIAHLKEFLNIMDIKQLEIDLYEADDIIGTLSKLGQENGFRVDIYSSDKDLLQLISDNVTVHLTKKGMTDLEDFDESHFYDVYGINVNQFIDLKAMMGDKSDNLKGIVGVGEKTAIKLLNEYETLENIIENMDNIKGALGAKIKEYSQDALVTKKMVTILRDAPIGINLDDTKKGTPDFKRLKEFYEYLELNSLLKELALKNKEEKTIANMEYKIIDDPYDLKEILVPYSTIYIETMESNYHKAKILAIVLKNHKGVFIIPCDLIGLSIDLQLFLSDTSNHKSTFDYKKTSVLLKYLGYELLGVDFDLMLAAYILNPSIGKSEFKNIATYLNYNDIMFEEEVYGKGAKMEVPDINIVYNHAVKKANAIHILRKRVTEELEQKAQLELLTEIEIPLANVLAAMEYRGVRIDFDELNRQEEELKSRMIDIESEIYKLAGEEFNILSPKQLGIVLFEHLNLVCPKKTKTGYSTDAEVLEELIDKHPIISKILEYRQVSKLYSTYIDGIRLATYSDNKVHTIYEQALTQTGRLSSVEPNLQNIPIRTPEGKNIRKMFIPSSSDYTLFSSDYSQIELRVLAHMAGVKGLIDAFNSGEDIHTKTASVIFGHSDVTKEERRKAKAVNFGIVYGISAFGLAKDIKTSNVEAQRFIDKYYEIYPEIKEFMNETINYCKEYGLVRTIKNRIRYIPDINSKIYNVREFAKRTAMNAPIQGSAADIMKMAMIKLYNSLEKNKMKSQMIIQVHDEVVLEVYKGEEDKVVELVKDAMMNAYKLSVPLDIDYSFGINWYEVK
ncbi:MAG: DNA polymerase I [Anaeroplasmataceae bacterium]